MKLIIRIDNLQRQFRIGPAKCPKAAVSSLALWPEEKNFLAYPPFEDIVTKVNRFFSIVEIQLQCPGDFYNNIPQLKSAVELCNNHKMDVTLHIPFMDIEKINSGYRVFLMPLVIPHKTLMLPPDKEGIEYAVKEMDPELVKGVIDFGHEMGIRQATMHISVPGARFTDTDWSKYHAHLASLSGYAIGKNMTISIETGGATLDEMLFLRDNFTDITFTHDIVHAVIDNIDPVVLCKELGTRIDKVHLSESPIGKDVHEPLKERGNYTVITHGVFDEIIKNITEERLAGKNYSPLVIFESPVSPVVSYAANDTEGYDDSNLRVFSYITHELINRQKVLILTHGITQSGKSTILKRILSSFSDSNLHINVISTDLERPMEQHVANIYGKFVPFEKRSKIYSSILQKVDECFGNGADIVAVDGSFGRKEWRDWFIEYSHRQGYSLYIIKSQCDEWEVKKERLSSRMIEGVKIPIHISTYSKIEKEFEPLKTEEIKDTGATLITFNSITQELHLMEGEKATSRISDSITRSLLNYSQARGVPPIRD